MGKTGALSRAQEFHALHRASSVLLLPNVWDALSAKLYEVEGFSAVGTTSAGIAATQGMPDGQRIGVADTVNVVRRITEIVEIPISADIEAGYSSTAEGVADAARQVMRAGAVGINIEDSLSGCGVDHYARLLSRDEQVERIAAIREMADATSFPLFINARTDVFLVSHPDIGAAVNETIARANAYLDAGANCVFVPDMGDMDESIIAQLVENIDGPINLIAGESTPSVHRLAELGVSRLSFGPRPMRTALWILQRLAREWMETGTYEQMLAGKLSYSEVNGWFAAAPREDQQPPS